LNSASRAKEKQSEFVTWFIPMSYHVIDDAAIISRTPKKIEEKVIEMDQVTFSCFFEGEFTGNRFPFQLQLFFEFLPFSQISLHVPRINFFSGTNFHSRKFLPGAALQPRPQYIL
jgi:hypothetical protein